MPILSSLDGIEELFGSGEMPTAYRRAVLIDLEMQWGNAMGNHSDSPSFNLPMRLRIRCMRNRTTLTIFPFVCPCAEQIHEEALQDRRLLAELMLSIFPSLQSPWTLLTWKTCYLGNAFMVSMDE